MSWESSEKSLQYSNEKHWRYLVGNERRVEKKTTSWRKRTEIKLKLEEMEITIEDQEQYSRIRSVPIDGWIA